MSFNKVDEALRSVGITLQTTDHQFRDFTDVIMELAEKWETLDSAQQRYIATQFAGNRQQSRFLALVSNADLLKENLANALNSEDIGTLQALKALDSLESKINQVQVAYQQFYTTVGIEDVWKALLDSTKNVIGTLNSLPKVFGKIPIGALAVVADVIHFLKQAALAGFREIAKIWQSSINEVKQDMADTANKTKDDGEKLVKNYADGIRAGIENVRNAARESVKAAEEEYQQSVSTQNQSGNKTKVDVDKNYLETFIDLRNSGAADDASRASAYEQLRDDLIAVAQEMVNTGEMSKEMFANINRDGSNVADVILRVKNSYNDVGDAALSSAQKVGAWVKGAGNAIIHSKAVKDNLGGVAAALNTVGALFDTTTRSGQVASGSFMALAGTLRVVQGILTAVQEGMSASVWGMLAIGVVSVVNGIATAVETTEERIERLTKEAEELSNVAKQEKANYNTLQRSVDKLEELEKKRYDSAESAEEYQSAVDELADSFPQLIAGFDTAGNIILDTTDAETLLADARRKSIDATYDAAQAEYDAAKAKVEKSQDQLEVNSINTPELGDVNSTFLARLDFLSRKLKTSSFIDASSLDVNTFFDAVIGELQYAENKTENQLQELFKTANDQYVYDIALDEFKNKLENSQLDDAQQLLELLSDEGLSLVDEINNYLGIIAQFGVTSSKGQEAFLKLDAAIKDLNTDGDESLQNSIEGIQQWMDTVSPGLKEFNSLMTVFNARAKQVVSAWQNQLEDTKGFEYLTESASLAGMVTNQIIKDVGAENVNSVLEENEAAYRAYQDAASKFWESLSKSEQKLFNEMAANPDSYITQDFNKIFGDKLKPIEEYVASWYENSIQSIHNRLKNNADKQLSGQNNKFTENYYNLIGNEITDAQIRLTANNEEYLNSILEQYTKLNDSGYQQRSKDFGIAALELLEKIEELEPTLRDGILSIIEQYGFNTIEGINNIKNFINNNSEYSSIGTSLLDVISETIIPNVQLGIQAATSSLLESWSDTSKELSKALSSGLELNEADALIQKARALGLNLDINKDFMLAGDKLILTSGAFEDYLDKLNESSNKTYEDYQNRSLRAEKIFNEAMTTPDYQLLEPDIAILDSLGFDIATYIDKSGHLISGWQTALLDIINLSNKGLGNLTAYLDLAKTSLLQTTQWSKGNYESIGGDAAIIANASHQAQLGLNRETQVNLINAVEYFNKAYSSFLQDAISKGFENINPKDYQGILEKGIDWRGSYVDLVQRYADYAGLTLSETNDLIAQAMEKDSETTVGAAQDALKDVTFIFDDLAYASKDTILKIANLFGKSFTDLFDEDSYDAALGGYKLKLEKVPELQAITNAQNMVADSIASYFERIATLISQGLSGKLDNSGRDELVSLLDKYNIDLDLKFTQTAEGLKLSADSAASLYSELYKVDSIRAGLVFDELVKQFTAAGEKCETISGTLAEIKRLENELAKEENKGNKELEDRLALYQRIAAQQSQDPNQFKFMDRNLPNGMQSPENYWNAAGKAYTAINEASTTGYMSVQDYYNIIMEMANLVEMSNGELTWMGMEAGKASERAAELIQLGMSALTNVDGKGVQVALSKLGGDFVNGAAAMKGGLDKGIKVMAQEQIKMLDAQIMMLEAVVAMEELGDIDVDKDGLFGFGDIFSGDFAIGENGEKLERYTTEFSQYAYKLIEQSKTNEDLAKGLEQVKIQNHTLTELFNDATDGIKDLDIASETYAAVMMALAEAGDSLDWSDADSLEQFVNRFGSFFPEGTVIDITPEGEPPFKLVCSSSGVARLEVEEDGVSYNGKHYDSEADAAKAAVDDMNQKAAEAAGGEKKVETQQTVTIDLKTVVNTASNTIGKIGSAISDLFSKNNNTVEQKTIQVNLEYGSKFPAGLKDLIEAAQAGLERAINIITPISELPTEIEVTGRIVQYAEQAGINFNEKELSWLNKLTGYISYYTDADNVSTSGLIEKDYLWGTITRYTEADDKTALISLLWKLNALTGNISKYTDDKADIDNLTQLLNLVGQLVGIDPGDNFNPDTLVDDLHGKATIAEKDVSLPELSITPTLDSTELDKGFEEWLAKTGGVQFNPTTGQVTAKNDLEAGAQAIFDSLDQGTQAFLQTIDPANVPSSEEMYGPFMDATEDATTKVDENRKAQEKHTTKTNEATHATALNSVSLKSAAKNAIQAGKDFLTSTKSLDKIGTNVTSVTNAESGLAKALNRLGGAVEGAVTAINAAIKRISNGPTAAKGTVNKVDNLKTADLKIKPGIAPAKGNFANARGTLMGELGEELYVTNGHYYIAGAAGPEFVDLPDDAIVFNHLQTKRLLQNGKVSTHGKPVTNEKKATSFATGNSEGPAMASARSVLEELKNIRAMWQALLEADPKKLGSLAGSGKGGSGGGGGSNKDWDMKSYTAEIQRWYNLLRQIAVLEKEITHQETLRSKLASDLVPNGRAIYESQKKSLAALDKEIINQKSLLILQKEYYADQQKELENSEYNKIFEFKDGTLQYRGSGETGSGLGLDILEQLQRRDVYGKAIDNAETAQKQLDYLRSVTSDEFIDKLRYNDDGTEVKLTDDKGKALEGEELQNAQVQMLENFFSNVSSFMNEFDSAADNIADLENSILDNESAKNEILRDIRDNQIQLEEKIRDAIVEREQQRIDKAKEERDALKESADEFLEGLNNSLNKERQMYQANQSAEDLNKLRRRLAILQRSGGSSSQIRSLQQEIDSKTQDAYFDAQQKQIDAVKEASDLEIERLDRQIEIMEDTLEYQQANGLLWAEVNSILGQDSAAILDFISKYSGEGGLSILANTEQLNDLKSSIEQYKTREADAKANLEAESKYNEAYAKYLEANEATRLAQEELDKTKTAYENALADQANHSAEQIQQLKDEYAAAQSKLADAQAQLEQAKAELEAAKANLADNPPPPNPNPTYEEQREDEWRTTQAGAEQVDIHLGEDAKKAFEENYDKTGDATVAQQDALNAHYESEVPDTTLAVESTPTTTPVVEPEKTEEDKQKESLSEESNRLPKPSETTAQPIDFNKLRGTRSSYSKYIRAIQVALANLGYSISDDELFADNGEGKNKGYIGADTIAALNQFKEDNGLKANSIFDYATTQAFKAKGYSTGGLVDYTGLAVVHGSPAKPESFLDAEDTKFLKANLETQKVILPDLMDAYRMVNNYNTTDRSAAASNSNTMQIDNIDINLQIAAMNSKYDAKQAANDIADELMSIARKSGNISINRR